MLLLCAQGLALGLIALRLVTTEADRLAALALISSLRKRFMKLPAELVADEMWRVRLPKDQILGMHEAVVVYIHSIQH